PPATDCATRSTRATSCAGREPRQARRPEVARQVDATADEADAFASQTDAVVRERPARRSRGRRGGRAREGRRSGAGHCRPRGRRAAARSADLRGHSWRRGRAGSGGPPRTRAGATRRTSKPYCPPVSAPDELDRFIAAQNERFIAELRELCAIP